MKQKKLKTYRFIVEVTSEEKVAKADIQEHLWTAFDNVAVKTATASAIRKLGDQQT
jgi:hypothetical protein